MVGKAGDDPSAASRALLMQVINPGDADVGSGGGIDAGGRRPHQRQPHRIAPQQHQAHPGLVYLDLEPEHLTQEHYGRRKIVNLQIEPAAQELDHRHRLSPPGSPISSYGLGGFQEGPLPDACVPCEDRHPRAHCRVNGHPWHPGHPGQDVRRPSHGRLGQTMSPATSRALLRAVRVGTAVLRGAACQAAWPGHVTWLASASRCTGCPGRRHPSARAGGRAASGPRREPGRPGTAPSDRGRRG